MANPFLDHPRSVGETYGQHLRFAGGVGIEMLAGGLACIAHGLFPFLFVRTGSATIQRLHARCFAGTAPRVNENGPPGRVSDPA